MIQHPLLRNGVLNLTPKERKILCGREIPGILYADSLQFILNGREMTSIVDLDKLWLKGLIHRAFWVRPAWRLEKELFGGHLHCATLRQPQNGEGFSKRFYSLHTLSRVGYVPRMKGLQDLNLELLNEDEFLTVLWDVTQPNQDMEHYERIKRIFASWID